MNLLHRANDSAVSQTQKKALRGFYSLKQAEQKQIIKKFEDEKIKSDILKTLYKRE